MAVQVQGLRTVVVHVADVNRAAIFYEETLGLPRVYEHRGRVAMRLGEARLLLHPVELDSEDIATARHGRTELYLGVPDVDAAISELRAKASRCCRTQRMSHGGSATLPSSTRMVIRST